MEKRGLIIGIIVIAAIILLLVLFIPSGEKDLGETERQQEPSSSTSNSEPTPTPDSSSSTSNEPELKEFTITAKKFDFTPSTITVNQGDIVKLTVTSTDVAHGIKISEYDIDERLEPNEEVIIQFTADKPGTFPIICSVFCGSGHGEMRGSLIIN